MTLLAAAYLDDATKLTILRVFDPDAGTTLFTSPSFGAPQAGSPFTVQCAVSIDDAYVSVDGGFSWRIYIDGVGAQGGAFFRQQIMALRQRNQCNHGGIA